MTNFKDLPSTWKRRVQGAGLTVDAFCKKLGISGNTFRSKNPTLSIVDKIETELRKIEK